MQKNELSVVIPSYAEEENLRLILPRLTAALQEMKVPHEILVVDSMEPKDLTAQVCAENQVRYLNRDHGNTYGDAVRTGIEKATGDYVLFMDADGSHSPEFIKTIYAEREHADVVVASRYIQGGSSDNSRSLVMMSLFVNTMYAWFLGIKCKDVSNSFKLYPSRLLQAIELTSNNFDIIEEILVKMARIKKHLVIKEVPYMFKERMFGHSKRNLFSFAFSYAITLVKLKFMK